MQFLNYAAYFMNSYQFGVRFRVRVEARVVIRDRASAARFRMWSAIYRIHNTIL